MKTLIQRTFSCFRQGFGFFPLLTTTIKADVIVSGYSNLQFGEQRRRLANGLSRRLVGILYADIVAYSRLTEMDEEGTHHSLVEAMRLMKAHADANNGRVAHSAGDAILVEFKNADSALQCAINVQLAAEQWNATLEPESKVRFRIGVNFGEVIVDRGDIYGNAVNLAARLEGLACSGGICVSETVRTELANKSAFKFVALGKQHVKNIRKPVEAFWIEFDAQQIVNVEQTSAMEVSTVTS